METYCFLPREGNKHYLFASIGQSDPDTVKCTQTEHLPVTINRGIQYMLILYAYNTNITLVGPIKTVNDTDTLHAYDVLYDTL